MTYFQVEPDDFPPVADAMDTAATELLARWEDLRARTLAVQFGQHDDVAPLIQMTLMSAVEIADECFAAASEELGAFSQGVRTTGEVYRAAETETLTTVGRQHVPDGGTRWG